MWLSRSGYKLLCVTHRAKCYLNMWCSYSCFFFFHRYAFYLGLTLPCTVTLSDMHTINNINHIPKISMCAFILFIFAACLFFKPSVIMAWISLMCFETVGCAAIWTDQMMKNWPNVQSIREHGKAKGSWAAWHLHEDVIKTHWCVIGNSGSTFFISFIVGIMCVEVSINVFTGSIQRVLSCILCLFY